MSRHNDAYLDTTRQMPAVLATQGPISPSTYPCNCWAASWLPSCKCPSSPPSPCSPALYPPLLLPHPQLLGSFLGAIMQAFMVPGARLGYESPGCLNPSDDINGWQLFCESQCTWALGHILGSRFGMCSPMHLRSAVSELFLSLHLPCAPSSMPPPHKPLVPLPLPALHPSQSGSSP